MVFRDRETKSNRSNFVFVFIRKIFYFVGKMGQWDNPRSIAMLFTGAFLVSLGLIALLNVEVHNRALHEPRIRNENLFEVIGRKISEAASSWKERNAQRRSSLYNFLIQSSKDTSPTMRKLETVIEDGVSENDVIEMQYPENHPIRHEKKHHRHNATSFHNSRKKENATNAISNANSNRTTVILFKTSLSDNNSVPGNGTDDILKKKLDAHQNCYTTNEVLEIIAITCLVNFIFWFLIISCVNFCTKNQKVWKSDSCESLESLGSNTEYEIKPKQAAVGVKRNNNPSLRHSTSSYNNVQDYVNSLTGESDAENHMLIPMQDLTGGDDKGEKNPKTSPDKESEEKNNSQGRSSRFIHFSNIFNDMISLDNLKPLYEKKSICREKHKKLKIMSSLSMENLIF